MRMIIVDSTREHLSVILITPEGVTSLSGEGGGRKHNAILLPFIDELLNNANISVRDLDAIACIVGPGSFTGIRLGVATCKGLARGTGIPTISMNALEILAYNEVDKVFAIIDARHGNYYGAIYDNGKELEINNYTLKDIEEFKGRVLNQSEAYSIDKIVSLAKEKYEKGEFEEVLQPLYLKESQAERELKCK